MSEQTTLTENRRPYFLWDYDLTEEEVRAILRSGDKVEKAWLIARILEYAKWDDIWRYLTVDDVRESFDQLRMKPYQRDLWAFALEVWSQDANRNS
jgi:hypothetical protein